MALTNPYTYEALLAEVLATGEHRTDRTGTGTLSLFAPRPLEFDLTDNKVALISSKRVAVKSAVAELLWILSGSTNINDLARNSQTMADIWSNWADHTGDVGKTYGYQWRNLPGVDQLWDVLRVLTVTPDSRRAVVNLWNASDLGDMGITPCATTYQFSLRGRNYDRLHMAVFQRSADMMLGVPFDLFQNSLIAHLFAAELTARSDRYIHAARLVWTGGDVHVYDNHYSAALAQLEQAKKLPVPVTYEPDFTNVLDLRGFTMNRSVAQQPTLRLNYYAGAMTANTLKPGDFTIDNYTPQPAIPLPIAV